LLYPQNIYRFSLQITTSESGLPGIYILELVPGKVAHLNSQLQVGDRILEIAHVDLWDGSPDLAARVIQVKYNLMVADGN